MPQGSTLGPLLFLIYINDFRFSLNDSISSHFADDTCILYSSKDIKILESVMNNDLISASEWLRANSTSRFKNVIFGKTALENISRRWKMLKNIVCNIED